MTKENTLTKNNNDSATLELNNQQDKFLTFLIKQRQKVHLFLKNGIRLQGTVTAFDAYVIIIKNEQYPLANVQMVYKHNLASIVIVAC